MAFLLLMELTSSSHTSLAGNLASIGYALGEVLVAILAYLTRDWLNLKWLITAYFALTLLYLYFVPESPYWLFSKKKYNELEACLRKIATTNGHLETQWFSHYLQLIRDPRLTITATNYAKRTNKVKIVRFLPRLSIGSFIAFVTTLLYFKISYGLGTMNNSLSPYWNIIIGAVIESVGYVTASILITTRLGRKYSLILYSLMTTICVLVIPFIMEPYPILTNVISQLGKLVISGAVAISWIYVPELFPTGMRGLANGIYAFVSRFGAIIAPIVDAALGDKYIKITFYVYSALTVLVVVVVNFLPETRNRSFYDEDEDSQGTGTDNHGERNNEIPLITRNP